MRRPVSLANPSEERDGPNGASTGEAEHASSSDRPIVLPLLEETLAVSKRRVVTGKVRISTRTVRTDETAEIALERSLVDVTRVPVGRVVEAMPEVRVEGDTTIMPVVEERLVLVKQLVLVEEVHVRRRVVQGLSSQPVSLRKQHVVVERFDPEGRPVGDEPEPRPPALDR